jgi:hypothetical protein
MADFIILTKEAKKVAVGKENRPRPPRTYQGIFFTEVGAVTGHNGLHSGAAISLLIPIPVHPALARTKGAGLQNFLRLRYAIF